MLESVLSSCKSFGAVSNKIARVLMYKLSINKPD